MDDSTQDVTWWLEMVKIARKCLEVLSRGEGQATAWRLKNLARVKKEVLAFSWGTDQAMMVMLMWRIKSLLKCLMEVTWYIWDYSKFDEWNQVTCSRWLCSSEKFNINMLAPLLDHDWKGRHQFKRDQLKWYKFIFLLILRLIGMPYY